MTAQTMKSNHLIEQVFHLEGRIGRLRLLAYQFIVGLVAGLLLSTYALAMVIIGLLLYWLNTPTTALIVLAVLFGTPPVILASIYSVRLTAVRRLHDLGFSGWYALLLALPIINVAVAIYLLTAPGEAHDNPWGPPPSANPSWVIGLAKVVIALALLALIASLMVAITLVFL